jgi:predicted nuclease of restriction endonuclease-like RecB superfamily
LLTADLSGARRQGKELKLAALGNKRMETVRSLAAQVVETYTRHVGKSRAEVAEALLGIEVAARDRKLLLGLKKIADDKASFESAARDDLPALRLKLFGAAAEHRAACRTRSAFERGLVLDEVAAASGLDSGEALDDMLFADLKEAQRLMASGVTTADALVDAYRLGRVQAVLLRATRVTATLSGGDADAARTLFRRLKLHQLLFRLEEEEGGSGYTLTLDGPMSLFEQTTRYGVRLAACLPLLCAFGRCELEAEVLWGKSRSPLTFVWSSKQLDDLEVPASRPREEIEDLVEGFAALDSPWAPSPADTLLHLPGVGLCAPDLAFVHATTGEVIYFELLGYWSREAVWQRVKLVEEGLETPIVFGVSSRLRVSDKALPKDEPAALVVFKGKLSARSVARALDQVHKASGKARRRR